MAWHNRWIYQRYHDDHAVRWNAHNHVFWRGNAVAEGSRCYSLSKNQLEEEKRGPKQEVPPRSAQGDSTDYDTECDENMKQVLATLPSLTTLPLAPSVSQPPATDSGAGLQKLPPPKTPPPTTSKAEQAPLSHKAIHHMPLASEAEQAERSKESWSPGVKAVFNEAEKREAEQKKKVEARKKKQVVSEADRPLTVPPELAPAKPGAGVMISAEQLQVVQETLDATQSLVPSDAP